jgi:hypothetical protein
LAYRSRKKGKELYFKVVERLKILERNHFTWPHTTATITNNSQSLVPDIFRSEEGLLSRLSYKVGASGLPEIQRRRILDQAFTEILPMDVNDAKYLAEWGKPLTSARLQKIANSIAAFTRNAKRQKQSDFSQAIRDWEADLAYLKQHYYDGYFDFQWPYTNIRLRK